MNNFVSLQTNLTIMNSFLKILMAFMAFSPSVKAQVPADMPSPKYEVRAVWLTTIGGIDWPRAHQAEAQKQELVQTLDRLKEAGINMVLVQSRVRATTIYPSAKEPWDGCLTGVPGRSPEYDPLQFCIDECHRRGMQCHAWVVTIPVGKWNKLGCKQLRQKYPRIIKHIGEDGYMDPEQPLTGDYLAEVCRDIVSRYDVDGIHLDYIRYPETWPKAKNAAERERRRGFITAIVQKINKAVKEEKPWVILSCSPIGKYDDLTRYRSGGWNARTAVGQDAQAWLRNGLMDALFPMMYFQGNNFYPFAIDWKEQSYGRIVAPGLGIYFLDPREGKWTLPMVERQMYVLRQLGLGHTYFRSRFFTDNTRGIYDFGQRFDADMALVPPMTWCGKQAPEAPTSLSLDGNVLRWQPGKNTSDASYLLYNIYASDKAPVDISRAENIVASRMMTTAVSVPQDARHYYAVTAVNRYGQESAPLQQYDMPASYDASGADLQATGILFSAGQPMALPSKGQTLDADFIMIETLQGRQVAIRPYAGHLDMEGIPDGMYQLRSLGKKGRTHRLGFFMLKR